jgi:hypothetical protein
MTTSLALDLEVPDRPPLLSFWEELESRRKHGLSWESTAAGLVALRLVDSWSDGVPMDDDALHEARRRVDALSPDEPTREALVAVLESIVDWREADPETVIAKLFAYGRALEFEGSWRLAVEAFGACLRLPQPDATPILARIYIRLGRCYLCLESLSRASELIKLGRDLALEASDLEVELLAEVALCRMAVLRGSFADAERLANHALLRGRTAGLRSIESRALHEQGTIAVYRGDFAGGLTHHLGALRTSCEESEAWRIRCDLGGTLVLLGLLDEARDVLNDVLVRSMEKAARIGSLLNLLEVESLAGDRVAFEGHRQHLARERLTPEWATWLNVQVGLGLLQFGDGDGSRVHLRRALALATEFGFGAAVLEVNGLLRQSRPRTLTSRPPDLDQVEELRAALSAIR